MKFGKAYLINIVKVMDKELFLFLNPIPANLHLTLHPPSVTHIKPRKYTLLSILLKIKFICIFAF